MARPVIRIRPFPLGRKGVLECLAETETETCGLLSYAEVDPQVHFWPYMCIVAGMMPIRIRNIIFIR